MAGKKSTAANQVKSKAPAESAAKVKPGKNEAEGKEKVDFSSEEKALLKRRRKLIVGEEEPAKKKRAEDDDLPAFKDDDGGFYQDTYTDDSEGGQEW